MKMMKTVMVFAALWAAAGGGLARAEEPRCVGVYREAHAEFFKVIASLQDEKTSATYGAAIVGGAAYAACIWKTRSYLGCATLLGGAGVLGTAYSYQAQQKMKEIEDSRRIYELYLDAQKAPADFSEEAKALFAAVAVEDGQRMNALKHVAGLMESGELCPHGHPLSWNGLMEKLGLTIDPAQTLN